VEGVLWLENLLMEAPFAFLVVTHDRCLLDRVSTEVLALDGQGGIGFFADFAVGTGAARAAAAESRRRSASRGPLCALGGAGSEAPLDCRVLKVPGSRAFG
jgi:ATPase subunit of ABC transporter with duplicated ATPase domains